MSNRPLTPAAIDKLRRHTWRGNVRELENTMHRAVLIAGPDAIDADAIMVAGSAPAAPSMASAQPADSTAARIASSRQAGHGAAAPTAIGSDAAPVSRLVGRTVADVERDLILETLHHTIGNRTHAANILGISIRTLRNKLKQYSDEGIAVPPPGDGDRAGL